MVSPGTYNEQVIINSSGNAGAYINIVGDASGTKAVTRGFYISGRSYVRIIGFEITHNSITYSHGIQLQNLSHHVEILNNYIHDISGAGIRWSNHDNSYVTIRGNEIYYTACPLGVSGQCIGNGTGMGLGGGNHHLVEYNQVHRPADFINVGWNSITGTPGTHAIVRNNYMHDFRDSYWADATPGSVHADMFQPVGGPGVLQNQIYEANFMGDNIEINSHILQMRADNPQTRDIIFRGNVGYNFGSYVMQSGGIDNVYFYNNAFHQMGGGPAYNAESGNPSNGNYNFNNIYSIIPGNYLITAVGGSTFTASNNLCFSTFSHASCVSTGNPLFTNTTSRDFHILSNSPAVGTCKLITIVTSGASAGASFAVADANFFTDGYGIAEGDIIKVGANAPVRITNISGNTITVNQSITWNTNDGVYWRNKDTSPDIGA